MKLHENKVLFRDAKTNPHINIKSSLPPPPILTKKPALFKKK